MNRVDPALRDSGLLPTGPGDVLVLVTFYFATVGGGYVLYMTAVIDAFSGYRFSTVHLERDEEAAHTLFDQAWKCIEARGFKATRIVLCKHGNAPLESSPLIKRIRGKGVKVECRDFAESHGGHAVALQKDMRKFRTTEGHSLRAVADFNSAWRACVDQYNKTELELYPCNGVSPETRFDLDVHSGQNRDSPLSRERVTEKPLTKIGRTVTNGKGRPRSATPVNAVAPGELTEVLRRRKAGETGPIWSRSPIGAFRPKKA